MPRFSLMRKRPEKRDMRSSRRRHDGGLPKVVSRAVSAGVRYAAVVRYAFLERFRYFFVPWSAVVPSDGRPLSFSSAVLE